MHQLSRLLLSGLVALSLTVTATAAQASWSVSIQNVMDLVYCLVGSGDCAGLQPGADTIDTTLDNVEDNVAAFQAGVAVLYEGAFIDGVASVDITSDNDAAIAAAMPACDFEGGEVWDGSACATPESSDPAPNCFMMGLCGQDGAGQYGIAGPYSQMSFDDAAAGEDSCLDAYLQGKAAWDELWDVLDGPVDYLDYLPLNACA